MVPYVRHLAALVTLALSLMLAFTPMGPPGARLINHETARPIAFICVLPLLYAAVPLLVPKWKRHAGAGLLALSIIGTLSITWVYSLPAALLLFVPERTRASGPAG